MPVGRVVGESASLTSTPAGFWLGSGRSAPSLKYYRVGSISQPARTSTVPNPV